jgi:hypothetical protein
VTGVWTWGGLDWPSFLIGLIVGVILGCIIITLAAGAWDG